MVDFTAFETDELDLVLRHETAHAKQWHTLDLLLVELVGVACWFNPFVWAYRDARNYADMLATLGRYAEAVALYDTAFYHRAWRLTISTFLTAGPILPATRCCINRSWLNISKQS